jgi:hypothetical protein
MIQTTNLKELTQISENLKKELKELQINTLVCTKDTVKDIKETKAKLNKDFKAIDDARKKIKKTYLAKYDEWEDSYKKLIRAEYENAANILSTKVNDYETQLKTEKEKEVKEFFNNYCKENDIDFYPYNIKVTLSDSVKSLKAKAKQDIDQIISDLEYISKMENSDEIKYEYANNLNVAQSVMIVQKRNAILKQKAEDLAKELKEQEEIKQEEKQEIKEEVKEEVKEEPFTKPEKLHTVQLKITASIEDLRSLKQFLTTNKIYHETVN